MQLKAGRCHAAAACGGGMMQAYKGEAEALVKCNASNVHGHCSAARAPRVHGDEVAGRRAERRSQEGRRGPRRGRWQEAEVVGDA